MSTEQIYNPQFSGKSPQVHVQSPSSVPSKKVKWTSQCDFITLAAGLVALLVGVIGLVDGIFENAYLNGKNISTSWRPFHDNDTPEIVPLIVFGIATAVAWTSSLRAIFRVASLESNSFLARGVRQSDLSFMLEMRLPSWRWLMWRCRMWKTSLFALFCVLSYVVVALMYRLAFRTTFETLHYTIDEPGTALIGCPQLGFVGMFASLMAGKAKAYSTFVSSAPEFRDASSPTSNSGWNVQLGWHGSTAAAFDIGPSYGYFSGPHFVGLAQPVRGPDTDSSESNVTVANHPECGPMLQVKAFRGSSAIEERAFWVGLGAGQYNVTFSSQQSYQATNYSLVSGIFQPSSGSCPLALDRSIYENVAGDLAQEVGAYTLDSTTFYNADGVQANKTVFALLLARMHANLTAINDKRSLIDLGLLGEAGSDSCAEFAYSGRPGLYRGEYWEPQHTVTFFAVYQFLSSGLLMLWALMLVYVSLPSGRLVVRGSLDQWMSFGADLGGEEMLGASSGLRGSGTGSVWALKSMEIVDGINRLGFHAADGGAFDRKNLRVKVGANYA
ncbi:hypothetical protein ONS95_002693 [Cadophora gregata]|uniref:uncharacterized protein n=1 Tax=Cadophora gregata TaxID=51156 RepID=UPI0026DAA1FB|nr:uncharacterized protein ONS95_002693 [Cadophora gregata]KAK0110033.1 hypothetical protein ONS95_002693 [Cadophora gregata]KAK0110345.1 hypothetical protein ONS96_001961 [Cadophora gregata f. sp. sojae]